MARDAVRLSDLLIENPLCTKCGVNPHALSTQWCRQCVNAQLKISRASKVKRPRTEQERIKRRRRARIYRLTATGKLKRQPCEVCGKLETEAHHYKGYSKEAEEQVRWLCKPHHAALERWERKYLTPHGARIKSPTLAVAAI